MPHTRRRQARRDDRRDDRLDDPGWMAGMAVVVIAVLMVAAAVTTVAVTTSAGAARRNADALVARDAALSGAELFFSAVDAVPATSWLPGCPPGGDPETTCVVHAGVFPSSLSAVAGSAWVHMQGGGVTPCAMSGTPVSATCIRMADTLQPDPDAPPGVALYQITLQVDAMTNCRQGAWSASSIPTACVYARVLQRFIPRQYANYLDYTGSELLDPALFRDDGGDYGAWLATCTAGAPPQPMPDTVAAASEPGVCVTPSYLGPGTVAGSTTASPGDVLNGSVATNDQTVFSCNGQSGPPLIPDIEAVSNTPSSELPRTVTGSAPPCPGPPPSGRTVASSPPPNDASSLASVASPKDVYGSPGVPIEAVISLDGLSPGASTYTVNGGTPSPWPATGVIYVYGDVSISGEDCLPVTVGSSGSISIGGNLSYNVACPGAVTGLVATDGVTVVPPVVNGQITCWPQPVDGQCMTVDAAVMALGADDLASGTPSGGSFNLAGWDTDASPQGSGGGCAYDEDVEVDGAAEIWGLTDTASGSGSVQWSGDGAPDPGTIVGGVTEGVTPGPLACQSTSPAMSFAPSSGGYISTDTAVPNPSTVSIAVWFNSSGDGPLVSLADTDNPSAAPESDRQLWLGTDGAVHFGVEPYPGTFWTLSSPTGTSYADGRWHLAVATLSPSGSALSVDGRQVAADPNVNRGYAGLGYWLIGAMADPSSWPATGSSSSSETFDGEIGRVAIFTSALTTTQAAVLYNAGQSNPDRCTGLNICALSFDGSYYERFRGAFGTYTTNAAGPQTETGIAKDFSYDTRLIETQPPYFLGPVSGGWLRSGASVTGGLTP